MEVLHRRQDQTVVVYLTAATNTATSKPQVDNAHDGNCDATDHLAILILCIVVAVVIVIVFLGIFLWHRMKVKEDMARENNALLPTLLLPTILSMKDDSPAFSFESPQEPFIFEEKMPPVPESAYSINSSPEYPQGPLYPATELGTFVPAPSMWNASHAYAGASIAPQIMDHSMSTYAPSHVLQDEAINQSVYDQSQASYGESFSPEAMFTKPSKSALSTKSSRSQKKHSQERKLASSCRSTSTSSRANSISARSEARSESSRTYERRRNRFERNLTSADSWSINSEDDEGSQVDLHRALLESLTLARNGSCPTGSQRPPLIQRDFDEMRSRMTSRRSSPAGSERSYSSSTSSRKAHSQRGRKT